MSQYLRYCAITVGGGLVSIYNGAQEGLRCRFDIKQQEMHAPSIAIIKITNLLPETGRQLASPSSLHSLVTIDAGYMDGHGGIFIGNQIQGIYGRESPTDTLTTIVAAGGDYAHNNAIVKTTLPPGSTPQQHLQVAMQAMNPFGLDLGYIGVDLSTPTYPRAVTLYGMARDVLANIAKIKNASLFYQDQKVVMIPINGSIPGGAIILNSNTGLIGMPTLETSGVYARCLINPAIKVGTLVQIDQKDIQTSIYPIDNFGSNNIGKGLYLNTAADGIYKVAKIDYNGDTRGDPWYMDLMCWLPSGPPLGGNFGYDGTPTLGGESQ